MGAYNWLTPLGCPIFRVYSSRTFSWEPGMLSTTTTLLTTKISKLQKIPFSYSECFILAFELVIPHKESSTCLEVKPVMWLRPPKASVLWLQTLEILNAQLISLASIHGPLSEPSPAFQSLFSSPNQQVPQGKKGYTSQQLSPFQIWFIIVDRMTAALWGHLIYWTTGKSGLPQSRGS